MGPKLSFIISTWNCLEHIRKCLESIASISLPEYEIVIVDSGSKDGTVEYIRSRQDPKITLFADGRRIKWSEANQIGLDKATGDWLCFSNPDIIFNQAFSDFLSECETDNIPIASPQLIFPDGRLQRPSKLFTPWIGLCALSRTFRLILRKVHYTDYKFSYNPESKTRVKVDCPQGSLFIVQRRVVEELGGRLWNPGYLNSFSDLEIFLNVRVAGFQMWLFPQYRVIHYGSYVTRRYPTWIEKDQARGFVLYLRHLERSKRGREIAGKMPASVSTILFVADGLVSVGLEIFWRLIKRHFFWNPPFLASQAADRFLGVIEGWTYKIE